MGKFIENRFWPGWHRQISVLLFVAMIWTELTGEFSPRITEHRWFIWFEYPFIFWSYSILCFALFLVELWDLGPLTRLRFCVLWLYLVLFLYGIIRLPIEFFRDGFCGL